MIRYNVFGDLSVFDFSVLGLIQKVTRTVNKHLKVKGEHFISYIIVDDQTIHQINKDYRKIDRPTDVISFANIDSVEGNYLPVELGDIYISYEKAYAQSKEYGHSVLREFAFLVTHGTLHLLGYDHMVKEDEEVMFKLQDEIMDILKIYR